MLQNSLRHAQRVLAQTGFAIHQRAVTDVTARKMNRAKKVVSERPFGPVRLVIGAIRGASRPFWGVVVVCGGGLGSVTQARYPHVTRSRTRPRPRPTVSDTATDTVTVSVTDSVTVTAPVILHSLSIADIHIGRTLGQVKSLAACKAFSLNCVRCCGWSCSRVRTWRRLLLFKSDSTSPHLYFSTN